MLPRPGNGDIMKRNSLIIALLACMMMLAFAVAAPARVQANAPIPRDGTVDLFIKHAELIEKVRFAICDENGNDLGLEKDMVTGETYVYGADEIGRLLEEARGNSSSIRFRFYNDDMQPFCFVFTYTNGEEIRTEVITEPVRSGTGYRYNTRTLDFQETSAYGSFFGDCLGGVLNGAVLLIPLGFTILIEWIISLFFRLKRGKVVVITNLITNLTMNIVLTFVMALTHVNYFTVVIIAEIVVMIVEYLIYLWRIKDYRRWLLAIYTVVANFASWGLYSLALSIII